MARTDNPGPNPVEGPCTVHLLGPFAISGPQGADIGPVPAGRASSLLLRLAAADGASVSVDSVIETLWPDAPPATATRTVASLVSRVRAALGADVISGSPSSGYRFGVGPAWTTDVVRAERLLKEARARSTSAPALAAASAQRGLDLLDRGPPLDGPSDVDLPWVDELTRHVEGLRRRFQRCLWDADLELGRWSALIDSAEAALELVPHDEAAGRALMIAHWNRGDRGTALHVHDELRRRLLDDLGVEPGPDTEALYNAIVRDEDIAAVVKRVRPTGAAPDAHLAGRDPELQALLEQWRHAATSGFVSVVVSGPIGSGRTTLSTTLADVVERTGGRVLRSQSSEGERSLFLHPILTMVANAVMSTPPEDIPDLLGPHLGTVAELVPELREVCPVGEYRRAAAELEHRRALRAIGHIISELSREHPVLMVFDDLHHAGDSTIEALQWLRHELRDRPVLLVATVQPDQAEPQLVELVGRSTVITLRPLTIEVVTELAERAGIPEAATTVWELTRGHLFFVTSVLDAIRRGVAVEDIAGSVDSVVLESARRAGPRVLPTLQTAAVLGNTFDLDTLHQLGDLAPPELIGCLEAAMSASLVDARDAGYAFSNSMIQQAMYDSVVEPVRRDRHRRAAEISGDNPERRAWHLAQAGALGASARAWLEAARRAQQTFSNSDAERLLSRAISAAEESGDDTCLGEALITRGNVRTELGHYDDARADHLRSERLAIALGDRELRARSVERLGWTAYYERDVASAIARAEEAAKIPGAHPSARVLLGRTRHWAGDFRGADEAYRRALDELRDDEPGVKASALSCLGALLAHNDRWEDAIDVLEEAVALCREIGAFRPLLRSLFFEGLARANAGDLAGALTTLETKNTLLERYDVHFYRARTNTCLAWIWRELGDQSRSRTLSERALEQSREVEEGELQVEQELHALCSLAECSLVEGREEQAAERIDDATALLDQWLPFRWRAELRVVELQCRLGTASAEQLLVDARDRGSAKYEALALHLLGRPVEAGSIASRTGSLSLMAEVGPPDLAADAATRLVARLPRDLRAGFGTTGRLARRLD